MAISAFAAIKTAGGTAGCLDDIIHTNISDGDLAIVVDAISDKALFYTYNSSSAATESDPDVIQPDSNTGNGRWILTDVFSQDLVASSGEIYFNSDKDESKIVQDGADLKFYDSTGALAWTLDSSGDVTFANNVTVTGTLSASLDSIDSINGGPISGFRNLIINGAMNISQRETSFASMGNTDGQYTLDRWKFNEGGTLTGEITVTQDTDVPDSQGFKSSLKIDCVTVEDFTDANCWATIEQPIEAQNVAFLEYGDANAKDLTLSFWLKSDTKTGSFGISIYQADGNRYYTTLVTVSDNNWNQYTVTIPGDTSGTINSDSGEGLLLEFVLACGPNADNNTADIWQAFSSPNISTDGVDNFLDSAANNIWITGVQLELGSTASEFEHRNIGIELSLCQRYYEKTYQYSAYAGDITDVGMVYNRVINTNSGTADGARFYQICQAPKRTDVYTVTFYSPTTGTSGKCDSPYSNDADAAAAQRSERGFNLNVGSGGGTSTSQTVAVHFTIDDEL